MVYAMARVHLFGIDYRLRLTEDGWACDEPIVASVFNRVAGLDDLSPSMGDPVAVCCNRATAELGAIVTVLPMQPPVDARGPGTVY